jgi:hypothetical protein
MGLGRVFRPWKASILIGAVVAALLVSCESRSTGSGPEPLASAPVAASGTGPRTEAEGNWTRRISALCARRNEHLYRLDYRDWPDDELTLFTTEALDVWDDYARRAARLRPPASYARRARILASVEASLRTALVDVRRAARAGQDREVDAAIRMFQDATSASYAGLAYIGVPECAEFEPYRPMD